MTLHAQRLLLLALAVGMLWIALSCWSAAMARGDAGFALFAGLFVGLGWLFMFRVPVR